MKSRQHHRHTTIEYKALVSTEKDLVFENEISVDLMFLYGKTVLHVAEIATRVSSATNLDAYRGSCGRFTESLCLALVER